VYAMDAVSTAQCVQFIEVCRNVTVLWNPELKDYRNKKDL